MARGGNQPQNTSSNYNTRSSKNRVPKRGKKLRFQRYKKTGMSAAKRVDNKQTAAINSLTKQVYNLQMSKYGKVQQNYHNMVETLVPSGTQPICFDMTDFTCERIALQQAGGSVFQWGSPNPGINEVTHWQRNNIALNNFYWENQNQDAPDTGSYLAMDATYFFEIKGNRNLTDTRIRIDIIAQKPGAVLPIAAGGATTDLVLPETLGYFKHLTRPYLNRINPSYFKKYMTKIVYINSAKTDANVKGTTGNNMRFSLRIKPNKLCVQNETNPTIGGAIFQPDDPADPPAVEPEYQYGNFGPLNVPAEQPLWCLISTDDPAGGSQSVEVLVSRRVRWRDSVGSSAI